jgi:hypothetical protein
MSDVDEVLLEESGAENELDASLENDDAEDDPVSWVDSRTNDARIFCQPLKILTKEPLDQTPN